MRRQARWHRKWRRVTWSCCLSDASKMWGKRSSGGDWRRRLLLGRRLDRIAALHLAWTLQAKYSTRAWASQPIRMIHNKNSKKHWQSWLKLQRTELSMMSSLSRIETICLISLSIMSRLCSRCMRSYSHNHRSSNLRSSKIHQTWSNWMSILDQDSTLEIPWHLPQDMVSQLTRQAMQQCWLTWTTHQEDKILHLTLTICMSLPSWPRIDNRIFTRRPITIRVDSR